MAKWGMVIDLKKCMACMGCMMACKVDNFLPAGMEWNRLWDYETGNYPDVRSNFQPVQCMQCENPACLEVCPTGATTQREDGIVTVDYDKCMGCGACEIACPYGARQLYKGKKLYFGSQPIPTEEFPYELRFEHQRFRLGAATKCVFCYHRIDEGMIKG
ncbi:4Fe-4S dicluster domain-containing protein [Candidatus Omnitrophota bacterium]